MSLIAKTTDSLRDHFLLATPALSEGFFAGSLTYICEHGESGAMGIVINQPLDIDLEHIFEHLELPTDQIPKGDPVLAGGPVQVDHGFVLHEEPGEWDSTLQVSRQVWLTTSKDILNAISGGVGPENHLIALGYAGWAEGQLEAELADNAWLTVKACPDILFRTPTEHRLLAAGKQLGIDIRLMSNTAGHA